MGNWLKATCQCRRSIPPRQPAAAPSRIVAAGPPVASLGANIPMIQVTHINGQMYPPNPNGPRYWLPVRTQDGQEILRQASVAPAAPPKYEAAPVVWLEAQAPDGRKYWYKEGTQETTWENPYANQTALAQPTVAAPVVWTQLMAQDGRPYFHNPQTNETAWALPPGALVSQPVHPGRPAAPSKELRQQRLANARRHGGGMSFW